METVALRDVALSLQDGPFGSNLKSSHYVNHGVRVVRLQNIGAGYFDDRDRAFVTEEHFARLRKHECRPDDVLIATLGDPIVRACLQPPWLKVALHKADCLRLRCDPDRVVPEYMVRFLNSDALLSQAKGLVHGQTRPRVNLGQLGSVGVPLPPIAEQRRIADILDQAEAARSSRQRTLALLDELLQSIFLDMFGDPAVNPRGWPMVRLGDLASHFSDGPFGSNLKSSHYRNDGVRVVRLQNIGVDRFLDDNKAYISDSHFGTLKKYACYPGDVLIGTLGDPNLRACIQPSSLPVAIHKADCVLFRPNEAVSTAQYVRGLLNQPSTLKLATDLVHGQTRLRVSMGQLRRLHVPAPPVELQRTFGARASAVEVTRSLFVQALEGVDQLFASLQYRAFRGEL